MTAFDIDPQRAVALAGDGVRAAATIGDAAGPRRCPGADGRHHRAGRVGALRDGKAAAALEPRSVVLLMATIGPAAVEDWARRLAVTGVDIVDALSPLVRPEPGRVIC